MTTVAMASSGLLQASLLGQAVSDELALPQLKAELEAACQVMVCLLYTSPSPRDLSTSRMPSSA